MGLNSFGFGGVNTHVILKPYDSRRVKINEITSNELPRLILMSGRTQQGVLNSLTKVRSEVKYPTVA